MTAITTDTEASSLHDLVSVAWKIVARRVRGRTLDADAWAWTIPARDAAELARSVDAGTALTVQKRTADGGTVLYAKLARQMRVAA